MTATHATMTGLAARIELKTKEKGNLRTIVWKDKQKVNVLMNTHSLPLEGNFYDEHGKAMKSAIILYYNRHMGYVDKSDCMMNSYSISSWSWKWTFWTLPSSTALSFSPLMVQNYHTENSD